MTVYRSSIIDEWSVIPIAYVQIKNANIFVFTYQWCFRVCVWSISYQWFSCFCCVDFKFFKFNVFSTITRVGKINDVWLSTRQKISNFFLMLNKQMIFITHLCIKPMTNWKRNIWMRDSKTDFSCIKQSICIFCFGFRIRHRQSSADYCMSALI